MNAAVPRNRRLRTESSVFAILAAEIIALNILWAPVTLDFGHFAFCDNGANLTLQYLISHGYRPTIDFAYPYGLLPIFLGRIWFAIAGSSPITFQILILFCELEMGLAFARIVSALCLDGVSISIVIITLWFSIHPNYPSIAHVSEALLLSLALSEQAFGRSKFAMMYATAAVFAKPTMGYVYLGWLVLLWFRRMARADRRDHLLSEVAIPIAVTGVACTAVLSAAYGPVALIHTIVPLAGAASYKKLDYGFFTGSGRLFWEPSHNSTLSFLFGASGLWICATIFLACAAVTATKRIWLDPNNSPERKRDEIILTCFVLHIAFVCLFFGNQWSWFYYSYFLAIGVAAAAGLGTISRRVGFAICCIGFLSLLGATLAVLSEWSTQRPRPATAWLWAPREQAREWSHVLDLARNTNAAILDTNGGAELMFPRFLRPVTLYLYPGLMRSAEVDRKTRQLAGAELVVVPIGIAACSGIPDSPEIRTAMRDFEPRFSGQFFVVYQRTAQGGSR